MVCLGFEPGVAGWKAQTNPLSYGGTPDISLSFSLFVFCQLPPQFLFLPHNSSIGGTIGRSTYAMQCTLV